LKALKIKVCGITQFSQVQELAEAGVDYAGLIFYEKSPRFIANKISPDILKKYKRIIKVGVFVNEEIDNVLQISEAFGLDMVQLHGDESPEYCEILSTKLPVTKVFRVSGNENLNQLVFPYHQNVNHFLFDTKAKDYGGTGLKFDWSSLKEFDHPTPFFLSGGIGPGDIFLIKDIVNEGNADNFHAVDLNSKFETERGIKDIELLRKFIEDVKSL
jgi:phosphoribosylanthranilate isomerase